METTLEPIVIAVKDGHRLIGISRSKFYEILAAGEIRSIKCGRRRLVLVESLREYVHRREVADVPAA